MAYIIGTSLNLAGINVVSDQVIVREARFKKELEEAINSIYTKDTEEHKNATAELFLKAEKGLEAYRSVHIAGKYFFNSKKLYVDKRGFKVKTK